MNYDKIGEFISLKRKTKNLTQNDLAKRIGVTDKAVSRWERGLGCPDVSILEVLANELDVSVLELLKGREIENEVIKVTEADDYIKTSLRESKNFFANRIISIINKVIVIFAVIIFLIFLTFNIKHYLNMNQKAELFTYIYSDNDPTPYKDLLDDLTNKYNILKNSKGKLTEEEYEHLLSYLESRIHYYSINPFYTLGNKQKYIKLIDFYKMIKKIKKLDQVDTYIYYDLYKKYSDNKRNVYFDEHSPFKEFDTFIAYTYDSIISLKHSDYGWDINNFDYYLWDFDVYISNSIYTDNVVVQDIMKGAGCYE